MNSSNHSKRYVIIDTDCGIDDALAIMLAANCHKDGLFHLLAITCCYGNTSLDNVVTNVHHTLKVCDIEKVNVYKGCKTPIVNKYGFQKVYHGEDGLGNSTENMTAIDISTEDEHAAFALVRSLRYQDSYSLNPSIIDILGLPYPTSRLKDIPVKIVIQRVRQPLIITALHLISGLAKEFPKRITVMVLGPLTNLALAHLIDPQFFNNLEQIVSMGGSVCAFGNSVPTAEFNFYYDPEAVHVVLTNSECPLIIIPWETCLKHLITWDIYDKLIGLDTEKAKFFEKITRREYRLQHDDNYEGTRRTGLTICDVLVVIAVAYPELICDSEEFPALIELHGMLTRGQLVVDRRRRANKRDSISSRMVKFITSFDQTKLMKSMLKIFK